MKTKTTATRLGPLGQAGVGDLNEGSEIPGRPHPAQVEHLMRLKKSARLVEVRPDEELPTDFCFSLRRILVPIAFDKASAVALDYASALALRFGSELVVLYAFEDSDYAGSSVVEAKLLACFSALRLRHLEARVFFRPGPTGEQVKAVANALGADLVVTSSDYYSRFLSYLAHAETGILRVQGVPCPVVVVNGVVTLEPDMISSTVRTGTMAPNQRRDLAILPRVKGLRET